MNYDRIIYRIIRLDKSIYSELIAVQGNIQRSIAIWLAASTLSLLAILDLFVSAIVYIKDELPAITQMLIQSGSSEEDLSRFNEAFNLLAEQPIEVSPSFLTIVGEVMTGSIGLVIQVGIIHLFLRLLLKRDSRWKETLIVVGFSTIPMLFIFSSLFISLIPVKGVIIFVTTLYPLVTLGSGLKQINNLRNIESVLLVIASSAIPSLLFNLVGV